MKFVKNDGGRSKYFPSKLKKDRAHDCIIRAIATALEMDYMQVWNDLFALGTKIGQLPNSWDTAEMYLESKGWVKNKPFRDSRNRKMELRKTPFDKSERYLMTTSGHMTAVINNEIHDTWDCQEWCGNSYYTKQK